MLASTLLISAAPKPVAVRLCLGREIPSGPTGPWMSVMGALVEGFLSRVWVAMVGVRESIEVVERGRRCREDNGKVLPWEKEKKKKKTGNC